MRVAENTLNRLWIFTGLFALLLFALTLVLAVQTIQHGASRVSAEIAGANSRVFLREKPAGYGTVVTVVQGGTEVTVLESEQVEKTFWYRVQIDKYSGWVPRAALIFE